MTNQTITKESPLPNTPITKVPFDLEERTLRFARNVIHLCRQIKPDSVNRELVGQLVRASGSVGANYREANDSLSRKDLLHRLRITRREAKEAEYWLELLVDVAPDVIEPLLQEAGELRKIFSKVIDKVSSSHVASDIGD